ncbi:hypothetical protein D3C71_1391370 [compost metagenome]
MALISEIVANAELKGIRIYSISAKCPSTPIDDETELDISTKCSLDFIEARAGSAFASIEIEVSVDIPNEGTHVIFELDVQGAYRWPDGFDLPTETDARLANILCRPLYSAAIMEIRKLSASMDLGELFLSPNLPWPEDAPLDIN